MHRTFKLHKFIIFRREQILNIQLTLTHSNIINNSFSTQVLSFYLHTARHKTDILTYKLKSTR